MARLTFSGAPFSYVAKGLAKNEAFISDVKRILQIDNAHLDRLEEALSQAGSFLDPNTLSRVVDDALDGNEASSDISNTIWHLSQVLHSADEQPEAAAAQLNEAIVNSSAEISEDEGRWLGERIQKLAVQPAGFARQRKAQRLSEATGAELVDLQIISDIRPVFNEDRSDIEGAVPVTTLRLDIAESAGCPSTIQVHLTEQQLADLLMKAESARKKIGVIKKALHDKAILMPATTATINTGPAE